MARLLGPDGLAGPPYRKVHLVPFGEYVPLPRLFFFVRQISTAIGEFTPAPGARAAPVGPLAIGIGVCYEIIYPSLARRGGRATARTSSRRSRTIPGTAAAGAQEQHFAGAVLRSVETARYLIRAAITGISGIVDSRGRILAESRPDEQATVVRGDGAPRDVADGLDALGLSAAARRRRGRARRANLRPRPPVGRLATPVPDFETMTERDDLSPPSRPPRSASSALRGYL